MKNIKIFAFLAVFLLSAAVSSAWAKDDTLTYKIDVQGTILKPVANIYDATNRRVASWNHGYNTLWPAGEEHSMNDGYKITFKPNQELDKTGTNENKKSTSTTAFRTEENTIFTVSVGIEGFYFKSVTFKEDSTEKASSSNIAPNSTSISVSVPKNKFFNYITVVLTNDFPYIDENGKEQIRKPGEYTVLTSLTDVSNLGGGWYVVQGEVKYTSQVKFNGDAHLILADGAELEIETEDNGIDATGNLTIYGQSKQNDKCGTLEVTSTGGNDGIYSRGKITISGGTVEATGNSYGIYSEGNITISGGTVTASGNDGIYGNDITIIGGTVEVKGTSRYGIRSSGTVEIKDGSVTVTGNSEGIYSRGKITISGGTVAAKDSDYHGIYSEGTITISGGTVTATGNSYGIRSSGTVEIKDGSVTVTGNSEGIYSRGKITISGGTVAAKDSDYHGISSEGNITISGGTVEATGKSGNGISSYGNVTISGGTVEATGEDFGIYSNGVTINGGSVTATGKHGIYSYKGNITLGWTNSTDFIKASDYYSTAGSVQIAEGKSFKDEKGYVYRGTLTKGQVSDLKGQKLEPFEGVSVSFVDNFSEASDVFAEIAVDGEGHVSAPSKHPFHSGKTFIGWFTSPEGDSEFDFTVKVTENTTAYAHWNENTPVEYIDENGGTKKTQNYILLTNDIYVEEDLPGGWYVVEGEVKYTNQVTFNGEAHLILADGAKMEIETEGESEYGIYASNNLTIYGQSKQSEQSGTLKVKTTGDYSHGIYSEGNITISGGTVADTATGKNGYGIYGKGDVTINGGSVEATGKDDGIYGYKGVTISGGTVAASGSYGIGSGGTVEIKNGSVTATGSNFGIYSSEGKITISGGKVTATGSNNGISGPKGVTISGGSVTATGSSYGIYSYSGDITLGWTNSTDSIKASSYSLGDNEKQVSIAEGKSFKDENGNVYSGTLTGEQLSAIEGKKLEPCYAVTFDAQNGDDPIMLLTTFDENGVAHVAKPNDPIRSGFTFEGWFAAPEGGSEFDFTKAVTGNTTAYAHWNENTPVEYIDENGETKKTKNYILLTNGINVDNLPGGWYVVLGEVSYGNSVNFDGDAHLILADGAEMEIKTEGKYGIYASKNLTIYGQNGQRGILNDTANGIGGDGIYSRGNITINGGSVTATGKYDGINGSNGVTINGGTVTATGNNNGFYSGFGDITVNGGSVTATGEIFDGIYSRNGSITINGGTVTATGKGNGIYGYGNITISGGTVTATGGKDGISSFSGDITLGWTNGTDNIKASSYYGKNGVSIAEGKSFKDENGIVYSGTLTGEQLSAIKGKTLEPCYAVTFDAQNGDDPIMLLTTFDENGVAHVAKPNDPIRSGFTFVGWFTTADGNTEFDFSAAITGNTTAYAKWSVPYIDENGTPKSVTDFIVLTEDNKPNENGVINLPGGWYVVQGEVSYGNSVKFSGDAHLILADEAKLEIKTEGQSEYGIYASKNLTIYGQNGQSGILNDTAKGTNGSGIYSYFGDITIIGGKVTATGTNGDGIYSKKGNITINGGTVEATGYYGINTAGHITLGWTNSTDSIKVSSIHLGADSCTVSIAKGKSFVDENGKAYRDTLTDENLKSIKNKTLTPLMPFPDNIVIANISGATYTGDSIRPEPVVTIGENDTLKLGKDYTLAYKDNLNASNTAKVIVKGAGKYYGEVQKSFTIDKAPLKITALNDTIVYGDEPASAGVAYDGFVGNETSEVLKGELALEIGYKQYDDAGKYAITPRGLNADNYKIEFVAGTLTVEPKVISIVWGEQTVFAYDGVAHAPTVTTEGFVEGHEASLVVTGAAVEVGNDTAKVALDEKNNNSKNYKLPATGLEKEFKIVMPIAYIDENGKTKTVTDYTVLTENTSVDNLDGGWYVVEGEVKYTSQVTFNGDAHLILADGATMTIESEGVSEHGIYASNNLSIYGQSMQSEQRGTLKVKTTGYYSHGIYSRGNITIIGGTVADTATGSGSYGIYSRGNITIIGGTVTATGKNDDGIYVDNGVTISGGTVEATSTNGDGIYSKGTVTINGGTVEATGNNKGIYVDNGVTINGGKVTATGDNKGIYGYNGVTISGGTVEATSTNGDGIYSFNGNITLGWTNSTDFIKASSYYSEKGSVQIAEGKSLRTDEKMLTGMVINNDDINGKTLVPPSFNGKFLSDVNIAVADIPVQKYVSGKPVCPSVVVTDGKDTLNAGTDYTVACFNNTTVSSATLDEAAIAQITGKGNYAGAIQKRFFIWNNIHDYAAVQVFEDADGKIHAEIDGAYDGADAVAIDKNVEDVTVKFNRKFTPNSGFSTIMLPFDIEAKNLTGVKSVIEFAGVVDNNGKNAVGMTYVWCNAKLGKIEGKKGHPNCNKYSGELKAYTPYMVEMETPTLGINGNVTLKSNSGKIVGDAPEGNWVFRGTLQKKEWSKEDDAIQNGQIWAFAGSERNGASIGKFVQFGGNNWVNPFRAYLVDCTTYPDPDASESKDNQPKPSLVSRYRFADVLAPASSAENSLSAKTPAASVTASLDGMEVVIINGDKDSTGERPTVIGRMNPATGEIRMLPRTKQTYDLKGRRVGNGKKAKGAYYRK